jgi:hypothetical protein
MKKNKSKLLIPVVVIVLVIVVLGGVLLKDSILSIFKPADAFEKVEGFPKEVETANKVDKVRVVVKSEQDFKNLMKQIFGDENKVAVPQVDFEKNDLYVATTDLNETKGVRLLVREMQFNEKDNKYKVILEQQLPGTNCVNDAVTNIAMDVVKIDKNLPKVDSHRIDKYIDCVAK